MCEESATNFIQRLALNRRPKTTDIKYTSVKRPAGYLPQNAPPTWVKLGLDAKLPMIHGLKQNILFSTTKLGKSLHQKQEDHFDLTDPNCYILDVDYNPLYDKNLKGYFSNPSIYSSLLKNGLITSDGHVLCTLREFNKYRLYLRKLQLYDILKERKWKDEQDRRQRDGRNIRRREKGIKEKHVQMNIIQERQQQFTRKMRAVQEEEKLRCLESKMKEEEQRALPFHKRTQERVKKETQQAQAQKVWRAKLQAREREENKKKVQTLKKLFKDDLKRMQNMEQLRQEKQREHEKQLIEKWKERYQQQLQRMAQDDRIRQEEEQKRAQNIAERECLIQSRSLKQQRMFEKIRSRWKKDRKEKKKCAFVKERLQKSCIGPRSEVSPQSSWNLHSSLDSIVVRSQEPTCQKGAEGELFHLILDEDKEDEGNKEEKQEECHTTPDEVKSVDPATEVLQTAKGMVQNVVQQATETHVREVAKDFLESLMNKAKKEYSQRNEKEAEISIDHSFQRSGTELVAVLDLENEVSSNTCCSSSSTSTQVAELDLGPDQTQISAVSSTTNKETPVSLQYTAAKDLVQDVMEKAKHAYIRKVASDFVKDIIYKAVQSQRECSTESAEEEKAIILKCFPSSSTQILETAMDTQQEEMPRTERVGSALELAESQSETLSTQNKAGMASPQYQAALGLVQNVMEKATHKHIRRVASDFVADIIARAMERCTTAGVGDGDHSPTSKELMAVMSASPYLEEPFSRPPCPIPVTPSSVSMTTSSISTTPSSATVTSCSEETSTEMCVRFSTHEDIFFRTAEVDIKSLLPVSCHPATPMPSMEYLETMETGSETETNWLSVMDSLTQHARALGQLIVQTAEQAVELGLHEESLPHQEAMDNIVWGLTTMAVQKVEQEVLMETRSDSSIAWAGPSLVTHVLEEVAAELQQEVLQHYRAEEESLDVPTETMVQKETELREVPSIIDLPSWFKEEPGISDLAVGLKYESVTESRLSLITCGLVRKVMREVNISMPENVEGAQMYGGTQLSESSISVIASGLVSDVFQEVIRRERDLEIQESQLSLMAIELVDYVITETKEKINKEIKQKSDRKKKEESCISGEILKEMPSELSDGNDSFVTGLLTNEVLENVPESILESKFSLISDIVINDLLKKIAGEESDGNIVPIDTTESKVSTIARQVVTEGLQNLNIGILSTQISHVASTIVNNIMTKFTDEETTNTITTIISTTIDNVVKISCKEDYDVEDVLQYPESFPSSQITIISSAVVNKILEDFSSSVISSNISTIAITVVEQVLTALRTKSTLSSMVSLIAVSILQQCFSNNMQYIALSKVSSVIGTIVQQVYLTLQPHINIYNLSLTAKEMVDKVMLMAKKEILMRQSAATCTSSKVSLVAAVLVERVLMSTQQQLSLEIKSRYANGKDIQKLEETQSVYSSEADAYSKQSNENTLDDNSERMRSMSDKKETATVSSLINIDAPQSSSLINIVITNDPLDIEDSADTQSKIGDKSQEIIFDEPQQEDCILQNTRITFKIDEDKRKLPPHPNSRFLPESQLSDVNGNLSPTNELNNDNIIIMQIPGDETFDERCTYDELNSKKLNVDKFSVRKYSSAIGRCIGSDIPLRKSRGNLNLAMSRTSEVKTLLYYKEILGLTQNLIHENMTTHNNEKHHILMGDNENDSETKEEDLRSFEVQFVIDDDMSNSTSHSEQLDSRHIQKKLSNTECAMERSQSSQTENILPLIRNTDSTNTKVQNRKNNINSRNLLKQRSFERDQTPATPKRSKCSTENSLKQLSLNENVKYLPKVSGITPDSFRELQTRGESREPHKEKSIINIKKNKISNKAKSVSRLLEVLPTTSIAPPSNSECKKIISIENVKSRNERKIKTIRDETRSSFILQDQRESLLSHILDAADLDIDKPSAEKVDYTCSKSKEYEETERLDIVTGAKFNLQQNKVKTSEIDNALVKSTIYLRGEASDNFINNLSDEEGTYIDKSLDPENHTVDKVLADYVSENSSTQNIIEVKSLCGSQTSLYTVFNGTLVRPNSIGSNPPKLHKNFTDFEETMHHSSSTPMTGVSSVKFTNESV